MKRYGAASLAALMGSASAWAQSAEAESPHAAPGSGYPRVPTYDTQRPFGVAVDVSF